MHKWGVVVLAAIALAASSGRVLAQTGLFPTELTPPERESVMQRARPDYAPVGGRVGDFFLYPSAEAEGYWDSNVFYAPHAKSDFYASLRPAFSALSDWGTNQLNFLANAEVRRFATEVSENQTNYNLATNGRLDILHGEYLEGGMGFQNQHEERYAASSAPTQVHPTEYQEASGRLKFVRERGIVGVQLNGGLDYYTYDNTLTTSGASLRETDRNRIEVYGGPKVTYEIIPDYHAFIAGALNDRIYQSTFDVNGLKRSSHGGEVDVGTDVEITRLITGEIFVGYLRQEYDDSRLPTISSPGFGGNLLWNVTEATSIRAKASRTIQEVDLFGTTAAGTVTSALQTAVGASIEHEVLRNVLLTGGASFTSDDYQGTSRTDNTVEGDLGLSYLLNRMWSTGLDVSYQNRTSNTSGVSYSRALIGAKIRLQY
ncbi:MAG: outer membrane beta-barrel protein [Alphaproteobacteria bacterium]|nr:outer membrane beta-barrel protein [Alphaproteobacteria bacterium]